MMRAMALVLGLLGIVVLLPSPVEGSDEERALDLVVRLDHDAGIGSGLILRETNGNLLVLTAAHVVEGARGELFAEVRIWPGRRLPVLTFRQFRDAELDLAIVLVEVTPGLRPTLGRLEIDQLGLGASGAQLRRASVRAVGHPAFQSWFVTPAVEVQETSARQVKFFHGCERGLSGGGVFDARWNLVGMVRSKISQNLCDALPIPTILDHLRREWELEPAWKVAEEGARPLEKDRSPTVLLEALTSRESAFGRGEPLPTRELEVLFEAIPGVRTTSSLVGVEEPWRLAVSVIDLAQREVAGSPFGVGVRTDIFHVTFLLDLRAPDGERKIHRRYEVEVEDFEGAKGWRSRGRPPLGVLLEELAEEIDEDLTRALGL